MDNKSVRPIAFLVLTFSLFLEKHTSFGADDTITRGQSLSGDQIIVSAGDVFELGFFTPGNSSKYYLGIRYKGVKVQTIVWVANRDNPFSDRFSSELKFSSGNLVLYNESKVPIWSTNANKTSSSSVKAVLLDNGNLVIKDGPNSTEPSWQSFDYPTDTWLPEGKVGYNKLTKQIYSVSSWKHKDDPAPGLFSFDPAINDTSHVVRWNNSKSYWSTGVWDPSSQSYVNIPEMRANNYYNFTYVSNEKEAYFTYIVINGEFSRFMMDVTGQFQQWILDTEKEWNVYWTQPREQCNVYGYCGNYGSCNMNPSPSCSCLKGFEPKIPSDWESKNFLGGCMRRTELQCGNRSLEQDRFFEMRSVKFLENNYHSIEVDNITMCESSCLNNCSCVAYSYEENSCNIWIKSVLNLRQLSLGDNSGITLHIRLAASEFDVAEKGKGKGVAIGVVAGSAAGSVALLCLVMFFLLRMRARKKVEVGKVMEGSLMVFNYRDIQTATKNFSEKLGGGGFGPVFKGMLPNGTIIAVKKLESLGQGEKQFRTEVSTIGTIQHVNLVRLLGFCSQGTNRLLVYDYMPNGSLDSQLFEEKSSKIMDWQTRFRIAVGTARGLVYLHEKCRDCIIHCDIKPENILLDVEFAPKVADFGLAKLIGREFSRVLTTMRGTRGYLAPEWIAGVAITPKADVYSYGMMLFELISGRRNAEESKDGKLNFFPMLASRVLVEGGDPVSLLDLRLEGNADFEELERVLKVACWCIQDEVDERPSMSLVIQILEGIASVNFPPVPRTLQYYASENKETIIFYTESSSDKSSQAARP